MMAHGLFPGAIVAGEFRVIELLVEYARAAVYVVEQQSTGSRCALKHWHSQAIRSGEERQRFLATLRSARRVSNRHLVSVVDVGIDDGTGSPWLATRLLTGESLDRTLARRGRFAPVEVWDLLHQIVEALDAAWARNLAHGGLTLADIFVEACCTPEAPFARSTVVLLDFGVAVAFGGRPPGAAEDLATLPWVPPEQLVGGGVVSAATDVWALGLLAFRTLSGRSYWEAACAERVDARALRAEILAGNGPPATTRMLPRPDGIVASAFDPWFARCVAPQPAARFRTASVALRALRRVLEPLREIDASLRARRPRRQPPVPLWYVGLGGVPVGPLGALEVGMALERGDLPLDAPTWREPWDDFRPLGAVADFGPVPHAGSERGLDR